MFGSNQKKQEVYNQILDFSKTISHNKKGALFVIAKDNKFKGLYEKLYPQIIDHANIFEKGAKELILKLVELDGAFLINSIDGL